MPELAAVDDPFVPDRFRTGKAYTIAQCAKLADTTPATVRRWLLGDEAPGHRMEPVFGTRPRPDGQAPLVSFLELVEIAVVARYRRGGDGAPIKLERLRKAHEFARSFFGVPYPFASLNLSIEGGHVMHEFDAQYPDRSRLALDMGGQWELPLPVRQELEHVDFDRNPLHQDPFALRWFPKGRKVPVVVDPHIAAGQPVILNRGVTLETVRLRWQSGEPIKDIANDYEMEPALIEDVLRIAA